MDLCGNGRVLQDFAALDALEAKHYATKQSQGSITPNAGQQPEARQQGSCMSDSTIGQQQSHHVSVPYLQNCGATTSAPSASKQWPPHHSGHCGTVSMPHQSHNALPQNTAQAYRPPGHQQHLQQPRTLARSSMQCYTAAHSARGLVQQPLNGAATTAAASYSAREALPAAQYKATPGIATGVLVEDEEVCIDLTSQPDDTAAPGTHSTAPSYCLQPALQGSMRSAAIAAEAGEAPMAEEMHDAVEDRSAEDVLMECSSNLLNAGIRVHKYSLPSILLLLTWFPDNSVCLNNLYWLHE